MNNLDKVLLQYCYERDFILKNDFQINSLKFKNYIYNYELNSLINYLRPLTKKHFNNFKEHDRYCRIFITDYLTIYKVTNVFKVKNEVMP